MKKLKSLAAIVVIFLMLSGTYRHDTAIEKYLELATHKEFNGTGQIFKLSGGQWELAGTCVAIDSLHILSAAHCFIGEHKKDTVVNYQGQKYQTYVVTGKYLMPASEFYFSVMNQIVKAKSIICHPSYLLKGSCDLVIIKLEKPLTGIKPLALNKTPNELHDTITGVGFGASGPANQPELVKGYHIKLAGQNIIDVLEGEEVNGMKTLLCADFDPPQEKENCNKMGDKKPLPLEYATAGGDSGGPLFRMKNNQVELVGITSGGGVQVEDLLKNGYYCQVSKWTRIAALYDWIRDNR